MSSGDVAEEGLVDRAANKRCRRRIYSTLGLNLRTEHGRHRISNNPPPSEILKRVAALHACQERLEDFAGQSFFAKNGEPIHKVSSAHLDGDAAMLACVIRRVEVGGAHAAMPKQRFDVIRTDPANLGSTD